MALSPDVRPKGMLSKTTAITPEKMSTSTMLPQATMGTLLLTPDSSEEARMSYVHVSNADGWFVVPSRERQFERTSALVRRSALILPVNVQRFVERAHTRGADAIVLDLEDSVPPREKAAARELVPGSIELAGRGGADVLVRINKAFELAVADLDAAIG